ncbi:MAG: hypothetical protein IJ053_00575 [Lachnospiraceae bacterium]|nr:hypothetical protein [Lachnospiraceae bacterium]
MGAGLVKINYGKVHGATSNIKSISSKKMIDLSNKISVSSKILTKGSGLTKNAIDRQTKAESEMMQALACMCTSFANNINMTADSFGDTDVFLTRGIEQSSVSGHRL